MPRTSVHRTHPEILRRLKRAHGHLATTLTMLEEDRPCLDLAQQLHAVERAISAAKKLLIHDHIDHCLEQAEGGGPAQRSSLDEFKRISKYL